MTASPAILIVPGLRDHDEEHWQTHLQARLANARTVPPMETDKLNLAARVERISRELEAMDGPVIVVAHSGGVVMLVHWAAANPSLAARVEGALLATPPDLDAPLPAGYPTLDDLAAGGWLPLPRARLPFPTILAGSRNDPLCPRPRSEALARDWGSRLVDLGDVGHLNPASGYGPWPRAEALIRDLVGA
jgi:predicted alpha/beta hydrolase family esterase